MTSRVVECRCLLCCVSSLLMIIEFPLWFMMWFCALDRRERIQVLIREFMSFYYFYTISFSVMLIQTPCGLRCCTLSASKVHVWYSLYFCFSHCGINRQIDVIDLIAHYLSTFNLFLLMNMLIVDYIAKDWCFHVWIYRSIFCRFIKGLIEINLKLKYYHNNGQNRTLSMQTLENQKSAERFGEINDSMRWTTKINSTINTMVQMGRSIFYFK